MGLFFDSPQQSTKGVYEKYATDFKKPLSRPEIQDYSQAVSGEMRAGDVAALNSRSSVMSAMDNDNLQRLMGRSAIDSSDFNMRKVALGEMMRQGAFNQGYNEREGKVGGAFKTGGSALSTVGSFVPGPWGVALQAAGGLANAYGNSRMNNIRQGY